MTTGPAIAKPSMSRCALPTGAVRALGHARRGSEPASDPPTVTLPHFNAIPSFVKGSDLISTDTELDEATGPLAELDCVAPLPFECEPVSIYMVWHQRSANDPAHKWLRARIEDIAAAL